MMLQSIGGFPALPPAQPVPPGERHSHFPVSSGEAHRQQQDYIGPGAENIVKHDLSVEVSLGLKFVAHSILRDFQMKTNMETPIVESFL